MQKLLAKLGHIFFRTLFKLIKNEVIVEGTLWKTTDKFFDPNDGN